MKIYFYKPANQYWFAGLFFFIALILGCPNNTNAAQGDSLIYNKSAITLFHIEKINIESQDELNFTSGFSVIGLKQYKGDTLLLVSYKLDKSGLKITHLIFQPILFNGRKKLKPLIYALTSGDKVDMIRSITFNLNQNLCYLFSSFSVLEFQIDFHNSILNRISSTPIPTTLAFVGFSENHETILQEKQQYYIYQSEFVGNNTIRLIQFIHTSFLAYLDTANKAIPCGWFEYNVQTKKFSPIQPIIIQGIDFTAFNQQNLIALLYGKIFYSDGYSARLYMIDPEFKTKDSFEIECLKDHPYWFPLEKDSINYINQGLSAYFTNNERNNYIDKWGFSKSRIRNFCAIGDPTDSVFAVLWDIGFTNPKYLSRTKVDSTINKTFLVLCKIKSNKVTAITSNLCYPNEKNKNRKITPTNFHFMMDIGQLTNMDKDGLVVFWPATQDYVDTAIQFFLETDPSKQLNWNDINAVRFYQKEDKPQAALLFFKLNTYFETKKE
ncbi:MAG: hypothetical protein KF882_01790 [Bacteroidia bacterium]|nr:hypothetical protein [Bacteroidia bacterium]MCO5253977.1 hypothetical protein [Bacteroidota bacterium]